MGAFRDRASAGGGGLHFRKPPDIFTGADLAAARAARDAYFSNAANAAALAQFVRDQSLAIVLDPADDTDNTFETYTGAGAAYDSTKWLDRSDAIEGQQGVQGVQGEFEIHIYRNASGPVTTPVGGRYVKSTGVLTPPAGWADNPATPGTSETAHSSTAAINPALDPDSDDVVPVWSAPAERPKGVKGDKGDPGEDSADLTRAESLLLDAENDVDEDAWTALTPKQANTHIDFGAGDPEMIDDVTAADRAADQFRLFPGVYLGVFQGAISTDQERCAPQLRLREKTRNTLLGLSSIQYLREDSTSDTVVLVMPVLVPAASSTSTVNADGTRTCELHIRSSPTAEVSGQSNGQFDVGNNGRFRLHRWGGGDSDAITSAQIDARIRALVAAAALIGNTDPWADGKVASTIARDAEVTATIDASVAAQARAGNASPWPDDKIPAGITRDTELAAAIRDFQTLAQVNARITAVVSAWARDDGAKVPDNQIPDGITRDAELAAAIAGFLTQSQVDARADARIARHDFATFDEDHPSWTAAHAYVAGQIVRHDGSQAWANYIALQDVPANTQATTEPGRGSSWKLHWMRLGYVDGPPNAVTGASIAQNIITLTRESGRNPIEIDVSRQAVAGSSRGKVLFRTAELADSGQARNAAPKAVGGSAMAFAKDADAPDEWTVPTGTVSGDSLNEPGAATVQFPRVVADKSVLGVWVVLEEFNASGTVREYGAIFVPFHFVVDSQNVTNDSDTLWASTGSTFRNNALLLQYADSGEGVGAPTLYFRPSGDGAFPADRRIVVYEAVAGRQGERGPAGGFRPTDLGETTFNLTGAAAQVPLVDGDGDAIVCPATGMIIAVVDIPTLGYVGSATWALAADLREAALNTALTGGLYTNADNEILLHVGTQSGASMGNKVLIRHIGTTTDATGGATDTAAPFIRSFEVTGERRPAAGSIAGDRYGYALAIGRSAHASTARIVGFEGTAANPASVAVLREIATLDAESGSVAIPAGVSLAAGESYTIRAQVFATGVTPAQGAPADYHDFVITAREAATPLVHFGLIDADEDATDIVFADDDLRTASGVAGSWSATGITAGDGDQRMYWAVPAASAQPTTWRSSGFDVSNSIGAAVDRTIGGVAYKVYLSNADSPLDDSSNGYTVEVGTS